ncbi:hypothetical protein CC79DRAFT_1318248 [Sarocladium strictum]
MWPPAHARSLLYQLSARDDDDCTSGTQFYRCGSNGFRGCCSVDPCDREDCPDSPTLPAVYVSSRIGRPTEPPTFVIPNMSATSEEITSTTTEAETTTSATSTTESDEGSDEEETSSEEPSTTTTTAVEESTTFSISLRGATTETGTQTTSLGAASTSPLASATKEPDTDGGTTGDDTGWSQAQIGGIVGGVVFLLLLVLILAVFFFRRRAKKQKTQHQESSDSPNVEGKDKTMSLMGSPDSQDPFAPFGGVAPGASRPARIHRRSSSSVFGSIIRKEWEGRFGLQGPRSEGNAERNR